MDDTCILKVSGLTKRYPDFELKNVSFSLSRGGIYGFIGRNGAGKSTTLNSLFNFIHPDSGEVLFFGMPYAGNEAQTAQRVGFVSGGIDHYPGKRLGVITDVTRRFYKKWDHAAYKRYMSDFALSERKTPRELSAGMRIKYSIVLALSHSAELLILDEPTSGLDPVSRDELLDLLLSLADNGTTILFSTHITSDLEKCAQNIIYIRRGQIAAEMPLAEFEDAYRMAEYKNDADAAADRSYFLGERRMNNGFSAIVRREDAPKLSRSTVRPGLDSIMVHLERGTDTK